ncbi:putative ABC transport system permease protein [Kitasatospora sp. MAA19]|uniref:ABC transporter permease n=1 Tax=Kitasatospora sp. MAA19 TaxID=3035090 RepID=UPI002476A618|nr:ABC transporter permease [Kitasatospora sp. MAA19]MDH6709898.1 putative ABC transport system permease protein [Kitasatospora sp. MAA19]
MSALGKVVRSGVGRRRVQSLVMALTTFAAVTSSVLSLGLLAIVQAPFDHAFKARNGAHLSVQFDSSKATAAQAAATAHAAGVTEASGPYPVTAALNTAYGADCTGNIVAGMPVAGRASSPVVVATRPDLADTSGLDHLALVQGRWPTTANEIVLSTWDRLCAGGSVMFDSLPGKPSFKVVGQANSLTNTATGFLTTDGFARLTAAGAKTDQQMLYRFAKSGTDADLTTDKQAIAAAAPAGSVESGQSYLAVEKQIVGATKSYVPFLVVFGILGLFLSVLIIAIVVSGAVVSGIRRIGILKSLGFTPWQVARAYAAQALIPATIGVVGGTLAGNVLAVPVLGKASKELGAADTGLPVWVSLVVPIGTLVIVGVTALIPALRAGRMPAVQTLVVGRAPKAQRGRAAQRLASRLPLPRPMSFGLAQPFAKPARAALVGAAVLFGAVSVTFAIGLETAFTKYQDTDTTGFHAASMLVVPAGTPSGFHAPGGGPGSPHLDSTEVAAALASIPGTKAAFGWGNSGATVIGAPTGDHTIVDTTTGDLSWTNLELLEGRWYQSPGEAVINDHLSSALGMHLGDTVTVTQDDKRLPLRIVGIDFDGGSDGFVMTDNATFTAGGLTPYITQFNVKLADNTSGSDWSASAAPALAPLHAETAPNITYPNPTVLTMAALVATLTLMMIAVAALGVLNTVVQDTRERIHDLGIFKALGMTPKQTIAMVLTSVSLTGLIAGLIGVPIGMAVEKATLSQMGSALGRNMPPSVTHVYTPGILLPLLAGGIAIALLGALLPAGWAARSRTATALRTE